jgi:murein tripeptide amidase MpaA
LDAFSRFLNHEEISRLLDDWEKRFADVLQVSSLGRSREGREIWLATLTSNVDGEPSQKPAIWIDANIHATELTGSVAALHLIWSLASGSGTDPRIAEALRTRTFYVVPRHNPDGAELALAKDPRFIRSSTRLWPLGRGDAGLEPRDVDGDGRILWMRIPDPNGAWMEREDEPRLLAPRPVEDLPSPKQFFRLLPEGLVKGNHIEVFGMAPAMQALDLNRNYPFEWAPEDVQVGAGPTPLSEPEVEAVVTAIQDRSNICVYIAYHTFGGCHLYPYGDRPESALPPGDRKLYRLIGAQATSFTGYPSASTLSYWQTDDRYLGTQDDWAYDHSGILSLTTEFWNPFHHAGISLESSVDLWSQVYRPDDELRLLEWSDREARGRCFVDWYPFDHPQFGPLFLGGWDPLHLNNPPEHLLEAEVAPHSELAVHLALSTPRLRVRDTTLTSLGQDLWELQAVVENTGWMATNVTEKALQRRPPLDLEIALSLSAGAQLVDGEPTQRLPQLSGRVGLHTSLEQHEEGTPDRAAARWIMKAAVGATLTVVARHPRAGVASAVMSVGAPS